MKRAHATWLRAGLLAAVGAAANAAEMPERELGLLLGGGWADEELVGGKDRDVNPLIGLRYGHRLGYSFNFFSDVVGGPYNGDVPAIDDSGVVTARGGLEWVFSRQQRHDWFLSGGVGAMYVEVNEDDDFIEPMVSVGLGLAWEMGANDSIRWEVRADHAYGDGDLPGNELTNYQLLVGYSWGLGAPLDSDGDGVANRLDQCPNTPKGAKLDNKGCPLDSDGDGVFDGLDKCPTVSAPGTSDGCPLPVAEKPAEPAPAPAPAPAPTPTPAPLMTLGDVNFDFDKATLKPSADEEIDKAVARVKKMEGEMYELKGYTDSIGSEAYNLKLSQRRADAVRNEMIRRGAPADRITATGYGEANPVGDNATKEGRARNRRVELYGRE